MIGAHLGSGEGMATIAEEVRIQSVVKDRLMRCSRRCEEKRRRCQAYRVLGLACSQQRSEKAALTGAASHSSLLGDAGLAKISDGNHMFAASVFNPDYLSMDGREIISNFAQTTWIPELPTGQPGARKREISLHCFDLRLCKPPQTASLSPLWATAALNILGSSTGMKAEDLKQTSCPPMKKAGVFGQKERKLHARTYTGGCVKTLARCGLQRRLTDPGSNPTDAGSSLQFQFSCSLALARQSFQACFFDGKRSYVETSHLLARACLARWQSWGLHSL